MLALIYFLRLAKTTHEYAVFWLTGYFQLEEGKANLCKYPGCEMSLTVKMDFPAPICIKIGVTITIVNLIYLLFCNRFLIFDLKL